MSTRLEALTGRAREGAPARPSALTGVLRGAVRQRLGAITAGRIDITDPWGDWQAGDTEATPRARLTVTDPRFYSDAVTGGALGIARAYMDGYWRADSLADLFRVGIHNIDVFDTMEGGTAALAQRVSRWRHERRANTRDGSRENIYAHYDIGNDLFALFLDDTMTYSAAVFADRDEDLASAQTRKLDRICRKLDLQPGHHVLEVGCGWGGFAIHAARRYGCRVTAITISPSQYELATQRIREAGLGDRITVLLEDYRNLEGRYDRVVSIEMIEAVGHEFLPAYFSECARLLREDGAMCLQAISMPDQRYRRYLKTVDFIKAYIFPGCCVPSQQAMLAAVAGHTDMKPVHIEDMAPHYAHTLRRWRERFMERLDRVHALGYSERFVRLWDYYLQYCEAGFDERYLGSLQITLTKPRCRLQPCVEALPPL